MAEMTLEQFASWAERKEREIRRMDHRPALEEILADLVQSVAEGFSQGRDPDGRAWKELDVPFRKPLMGKRGTMMRRVIAAHGRGKIEPKRLVVTIDSDIAGMHNFGRKRPKREFLGFGDKDHEQAAATIADKVSAALVKP